MKQYETSAEFANVDEKSGVIYLNHSPSISLANIESVKLFVDENRILHVSGEEWAWRLHIGKIDIKELKEAPIPKYIKKGVKTGLFRKVEFEYVEGFYRVENRPYKAIISNWKIIDRGVLIQEP